MSLQELAAPGVIEVSTVHQPCWTTVAHQGKLISKLPRNSSWSAFVVSSFRRPKIFVTAMLRPGSNFKIRQSAAHDNRIRLKYTPREWTQRPKQAAAVAGHHVCGTIVQTRLLWVSSNIVGVGLTTEVGGKVVLWKVTQLITHMINVNRMIDPNRG